MSKEDIAIWEPLDTATADTLADAVQYMVNFITKVVDSAQQN